MPRPFPNREVLFLVAVAILGLVVLPCLNAFVPPDTFFHVSNFTINTYGKYLCYAVLGKITVLAAIILFLQWRPAGLFVTKSRSLEG